MGINMVILCGTVITMPHPYGQKNKKWRRYRMFLMDVNGERIPVFIDNRDYRLLGKDVLDVFRMKGRLKVHGIISSDNVSFKMRIVTVGLYADEDGSDRNDLYISGIVQGTWEISERRYVTVGIADGRLFSCLTGHVLFNGVISRHRKYAFIGRVDVISNGNILLKFENGKLHRQDGYGDIMRET